MSLAYFPVVATIQALVTDTGDAGGDPDTENVSSFVYFTPSARQVYSNVDHKVYVLQKIRARTNASDGQLKNIDGTTVNLVANNAAIGIHDLTYLVEFDHVVLDEQDTALEPFRFLAPQDGSQVDLATVERMLA